MGSIRKFIWRIIWLFSFCTLGITVIYKDGVVIKLESIWGEVALLLPKVVGLKEGPILLLVIIKLTRSVWPTH